MALYTDLTLTSPALVADCLSYNDGGITSSTATFSSSLAGFTTCDVGKTIVIERAGSAGADLRAIINSVSAGVATLSVSASTTVSDAYFSYGTNNKTAIDNAIAVANANKLQLFISPGLRCLYSDTSDLTLPDCGIAGGGSILGITCVYSSIKGAKVDAFRCDNLLFSGVWYFDVEYVECRRLTLMGGSMGTYWNKFGTIVCGTFLIDCSDAEGINQNTFQDVKIFGLYEMTSYHSSPVRVGGLYITGGTVTSPPSNQRAESNVFYAVDSATYGIPGTNGCQVLNDSAYNPMNVIHMWYAERGYDGGTPPSPYIEGNWHVLGSTVTSDGTHIRISNRNHYLFSSNSVTINDGDFFAGALSNSAVGGEWDVVKVIPGYDEYEVPYCIELTGALQIVTPSSDTGCPSGIEKMVTIRKPPPPYGYDYQWFNIKFAYTTEQIMNGYIWYKGDDFYVITNQNDDNFTTGSIYEFDDGTDIWKLYRFEIPGVTTAIKIFVNGSDTSEKNISINSFFITNQKTAFLPSKKMGSILKGEGSTSSTSSGTFYITIPTSAANSMVTGVAKILVQSSGGGTSVQGLITVVFTALYNLAVTTSVLDDMSLYKVGAVGLFTASGNNSPTQLGIDFPAVGTQLDFSWEIELH